MASSPWGKIDSVTKLIHGVSFVGTPGHGGVRVSKTAAARLSPYAREKAIKYAGMYWFEEDCDYAIVFYELSDVFEAECMGRGVPETERGARWAEVVSSLTAWNVPYCLAMGIPVPAPRMAKYESDKRCAARAAANDPTLVTAAVGAEPGVIRVWTADNKEHRVTEDSYDAISSERNLSELVPIACPACGGDCAPLGTLGSRAHYRCRGCGIDSSA